MNAVRFSANYRLVDHGQPVTQVKVAQDVTTLLQTALSLSHCQQRTERAPADMVSYLGRSVIIGPGVPSEHGYPNADEFRIVTDDTLADLQHHRRTPNDILDEKPQGDIDVADLLKGKVARALFPSVYQK